MWHSLALSTHVSVHANVHVHAYLHTCTCVSIIMASYAYSLPYCFLLHCLSEMLTLFLVLQLHDWNSSNSLVTLPHDPSRPTTSEQCCSTARICTADNGAIIVSCSDEWSSGSVSVWLSCCQGRAVGLEDKSHDALGPMALNVFSSLTLSLSLPPPPPPLRSRFLYCSAWAVRTGESPTAKAWSSTTYSRPVALRQSKSTFHCAEYS